MGDGDRGGGRDGVLGERGAADEGGHGIGPEAGDDEEDDEDDENGTDGAVDGNGGFVEGLGPVHGLDGAEVIVKGGDGGEDGEEEERVESAVPRDEDDHELGDEAAHGRHTGHRDEGEGEGGGEKRGALREAGEMMDFEAREAAFQNGEDDEGGEGSEEVADEVDGDGDLAGLGIIVEGHDASGQDGGGADDGDENESGMADAGVAEHALEIALGNGGEVAEEEGCNRADGQNRNPDGGGGLAIEEAEDDAHEDDESARLGTDGEEGGDGIGRAFIDVGRPALEGDHGDLETDAGDDEEQAKGDASGHAVMMKPHPDKIEARAASQAGNVGDAHDEKGGGESARG